MTTPEAARHDLYTALAEILGTDRASTLMAHLPSFDPSHVADRLTRIETDLAVTRTEVAGLRADVSTLRSEVTALRSEFGSLSGQVTARLDRMTLTIVAGFFVTVASIVATRLA